MNISYSHENISPHKIINDAKKESLSSVDNKVDDEGQENLNQSEDNISIPEDMKIGQPEIEDETNKAQNSDETSPNDNLKTKNSKKRKNQSKTGRKYNKRQRQSETSPSQLSVPSSPLVITDPSTIADFQEFLATKKRRISGNEFSNGLSPSQISSPHILSAKDCAISPQLYGYGRSTRSSTKGASFAKFFEDAKDLDSFDEDDGNDDEDDDFDPSRYRGDDDFIPAKTCIAVSRIPSLYEKFLDMIPEEDKKSFDLYSIQTTLLNCALEKDMFKFDYPDADEDEANNNPAASSSATKIHEKREGFSRTENKILDFMKEHIILNKKLKIGRSAPKMKQEIDIETVEKVLKNYQLFIETPEQRNLRSFKFENANWGDEEFAAFREALVIYPVSNPDQTKNICAFMNEKLGTSRVHPNHVVHYKRLERKKKSKANQKKKEKY